MGEAERQHIIDNIAAMSDEEKKLVAQCIPYDICLERIKNELDCMRNYVENVKNSSKFLEKF